MLVGSVNRDHRPEIADSFAMDAASNAHSCFYRSGYDVSLPLGPENHYHSLAEIASLDRSFFLTFKVCIRARVAVAAVSCSGYCSLRHFPISIINPSQPLLIDGTMIRYSLYLQTQGTVYLSGHGSEERLSTVQLHDEEHGVIMSVHCFENHGEHLLPENIEYCQSLKSRYDDYEYGTLMDTTFGLVPAGRSPGTYRLAEIMGAGAIPVIVARDIVSPFREQFDWPSFSFTFAPDQVGPYMMNVLRAVPQAQLEEMQVGAGEPTK